MKRTQPLVVNPRLAQVNEFADHIHDVDGIHNLIDGRSVNHGDKSIKKHGESQIIFAQKSSFVHKRAIFVHFVWLCAQKVVPLRAILENHPREQASPQQFGASEHARYVHSLLGIRFALSLHPF